MARSSGTKKKKAFVSANNNKAGADADAVAEPTRDSVDSSMMEEEGSHNNKRGKGKRQAASSMSNANSAKPNSNDSNDYDDPMTDAGKEDNPQVARSAAADENEEEGSIEIGACSMCHCALDFSDRAAFFKEDREEDYNNDKQNDDNDDDDESSFFFRPDDPYVPVELYDKANALVYCDGCDRMYHQKCHFVPLINVPRQKWECLLCQSAKRKKHPSTGGGASESPHKKKKKGHNNNNNNNNKKSKNKQEEEALLLTKKKEQQEWTELMKHVHQMFLSPPNPNARTWESKWVYATRHLKAQLWRTELTKRLKQAVTSSASTYRLAETAVITLTSTQKNRSHFSTANSQELAQTLVKLYGARLNWRELCFQLDDIRRSTNERWHAVHQFVTSPVCANREEFVERVLFPFGTQHPRRLDPRTQEMKKALTEQDKAHAIPHEIFVEHNKKKNKNKSNKEEDDRKPKAKQTASKKKKAPPQPPASPKKGSAKKAATNGKKAAETNKDDDDSGVSLDDLRCCVCHTSTATDENDLVMCDSGGCYRAYHMKCLSPELTQRDIENEHDDWFCPLCKALAETLLSIQVEFMGDDWEQARYHAQLEGKQCDESHKSWDKPEEVFPTCVEDYKAALQMKRGKRNKATDDLLARVLGLDELPDHDSDDEIEDEHFDLEAFHEERRRQYMEKEEEEENDEDGDDDEESSHSSQATLQEMDSFCEMNVGKGELDALSKGSSEDEDESDNEARVGPVRRSRRQRQVAATSRNTSRTNSNSNSVSDLGEFDEANIIEKPRSRKPVDYIRLNEAIFGDVSEHEAQKLDDGDDFEHTVSKREENNDSDEDSNDGGSDSDSNSDEDGEDDEDSGSKHEDETEEVRSTSKTTATNGVNGKKTASTAKAAKKKKAAKEAKNGIKNGVTQKGLKKRKASTSADPSGNTKKRKTKEAKEAAKS